MSITERAVQLLRAGRLVAFPTETVYGLGADATGAAAVRGIFAAKGRPATNPLIVHVADVATARRYARRWPAAADALAAAFWPGPLTLVVPKADVIPDVVTASRSTVGLRAPDHPLALELLIAFDGPVAAPSANRSNRISPTTAQHVRDELGDAVDLVLDGGPCAVGIESTVLDLTGDAPTILRPGGVTRRAIEQIIGPVGISTSIVEETMAASSPGQHAVHYAPTTPAFRASRGEIEDLLRSKHAGGANGVVLLRLDPTTVAALTFAPLVRHAETMPPSPEEYARELYVALRRADAMKAAMILIEMPPDRPEWAAVRDRLIRATKPYRT